MSEEALKYKGPHLASSFHEADYPYPHRYQYQDHMSGEERASVLLTIRGAIETAMISDYHIVDGDYAVTAYFKRAKDFVKFGLAGFDEGEMPFDFLELNDSCDVPAIQNLCDELQEFADKEGFENLVEFDADVENGRVFAIAKSKRAYFEFIACAEQNGLDTKYDHLRREEDALNLPEPDEEEAIDPNIIDPDMEQPAEKAPYERFIRGGATETTNVTATLPPPALAKEASDGAFPYYAHFPIPPELGDLRDGRDRIKNHLLDKIRTINALDYKLIEHHHNFELRLKHAVDEVHFRVAYNSAADMPMRTTFALPQNKRKHISEVSKLRKRFKQAVATAQQDSAVQIKLDPAEKVVVVTADNVSAYFSFWRQISPAARRSLLNP